MRELSVFVDESGDFGEYDYHAPFYIITLVFHDQNVNIQEDLVKLETELSQIGWPNHCVHAGPIIRSEYEYKDFTIEERQKILKKLMTFTRKIDIKYQSICIEKKNISDSVEVIGKLSKQLANFIKNHIEYFLSFDSIKIYYDNGQVEVTRILSSVFNSLLDNVEFRKVLPSDYRLFQVADLICTLKLTELKMNKHVLSKSESIFFKDVRTIRKNYLKPLDDKEMK
jgi:hypothetical protein